MNHIIILQNFGRNIVLKNIQKKLKLSCLYTVKTQSFVQLRKIQKDIKVKEIFKKFISLFKLSEQEIRILEMGILISYHPENLFGNDRKKWHKEEKNIKDLSDFLILNLVELNSYKNLKIFLESYIIEFKKWKKNDKFRTIEGIIISYHFRKEHLDKVINDNLDKNQKKEIIKTLNHQLNHLEKSILMIQPNFPISILQNEHDKLYQQYRNGWITTIEQIQSIVLKSFHDKLKHDLIKGNYLTIKNELISITNRLLLISPKKIKKSLEFKFNDINFIFENSQINSTTLINFLTFIIDTIIIFDSPSNDKNNKIWKYNMTLLFKNNINDFLPNFLISLNQKIDEIICKIKSI